ncbi:MAG: hypothetical protein J6I68_00490 [Butyrivibrio sp.]|uniref:hypothetical protein n=1 Tax=Butyrivibrio sp. TaxID=28121 RepID=UPI001B59873C|nr:hypothetical protein [Butyrivibrio sp.]MBP3781705.1 hypothetical protein [Butyrivibrio sp.]
MTEIERIYGRYIAQGKSLVRGRKYEIGKWYPGYKFVVMCDNAPILAVKCDGSAEVIRPAGEKVLKQLQKVNIA